MRLLRHACGGLLAVLVAAGMPMPLAAQEDDPATELRVTLSRLLGEHAFLTLEVVRTGTGANEESAAAARALDANTVDLLATIERIYGADAAAAFGQLWRDHIGYLIDYARAGAAGDAQAAELAGEQLDRYVADFTELVMTSIPALPEDAVAGLIDEHVQQLEHVADLDESAYGDAYRSIRETYRHMYDVGDQLALGITVRFPDRFEGRATAFSPATDVRVELDRLLGEHTYLAALAMRAHLAAAPDAASAAQALNANGEELTGVIEEVYGTTAADAFSALWESHLDAYLAYVAALTGEDAAERQSAIDALAAYRLDLSEFVAGANPNVSRADLERLLAEHNDLLVTMADEYAREDYVAAYEAGRDAYAHSRQMGSTLGHAIADQFPQRFPDTALGHGDAANAAFGLALVALFVVGVVGVEAWRWRARRMAG